MSEQIYRYDILKYALFFKHTMRGLTPCKQCIVDRDTCGQPCMECSPAVHCYRVQKFGWWKICCRYIRHLRTGKYTK